MAFLSRIKMLPNEFSVSIGAFRFPKSVCTKANPYHLKMANNLIAIFTKRPFMPESPELKELGLKLTTEVVETVLKEFKSWRIAQMFFKWASDQNGYRHNIYTYNVMASILSRARQNASLRVLATDMLNSRCYMTPGALGYFFRCLGSQGLVQEANALFDGVKRWNLCTLNSYSYNCLLEAISKSGNVHLLELRLKEMSSLGWQLDKYTCTPVLQCYCNAGRFAEALDVFNEMLENGWVDAHVMSILVVSTSKFGEVDKAFEMIERMEDFKISLNEKTFSVLIHGFVREGRVDKALQLVHKMMKLGISPDIQIYDALIGGLCKNKEINVALQIFLQVKQLGIRPDVKILSQLLCYVTEESDIIWLVKERACDLDMESLLLLHNSVLKAFINSGLVDKAYHLLRSMMGDAFTVDVEVDLLFSAEELVQPNTISFEIVIAGLCRHHKIDEALSLFRDMDRIACQRSVLLYNDIIDYLSNANRLNECYELLIEMKDLGFQPTQFTYNSIFGCLCRRVDVAGALCFIREIRLSGHEPWIKNYTLLIKKLCNDGRVVEACNFLAEMVEEGFLPHTVAYSAVIDGFLKIKEIDRALHLFREICKRGYCPDVVAYNILINGLCKEQRLSEAQDILNEMLIKGLVPSVVTYNVLIDGWCKCGEVDQARLCLLRMVEKEREPNVITYTTLMDGFCNVKRPNEALKLFMEMEENGCSPNRISFMALINGLCKCNLPHDALVYLQMMEEREMLPDAFIYVALVDAFLSNSNQIAALEVLEKMHKNGIFPDSNDKNHLIITKAISVLLEDPMTSLNMKNLVAQDCFPTHVVT
ncbi:hypothetical protein M9H77_09363 [Catharanthus roseus]|uniref:Uncharacterized protein n=1 Tax=Catharanthus roseus TaxID=4058 RepID=A0ACC0C0B8_CATRO|nr:hypothetical protein M9H77_09363 [Catharanthus roseus]